VPALYWLGRELYSRRVGLLMAALATTTVWTLNLSRVALRVSLLTPILALALALLWRGGRERRPWPMIAAGALYGLSFYTYLAARFTPLALAALALYLLLWRRRCVWWRGWALFAGTALAVFAPLGFYFATHWAETLGRAGQVSILNPGINGGDPWGTLGLHLWRTLLGFFYRGDFIPRHNVPLRPVFDPLTAAAFAGGLALSIWGLARKGRAGDPPSAEGDRPAAAALSLLWLGLMLLPTILAEDAPHFLRGAGILPALFIFPARGLAAGWEWLARRGRPWLAGAALAAVLLCGAGSNLWAYATHLRSEAVYYQFESGATELAVDINRYLGSGWPGEGLRAAEGDPLPGRQVWVAGRLWRNWPSVRYLVSASDALHVLDGDSALPAAAPGERVLLAVWPFEDNGAALAALPADSVITAAEGARERGDLEAASRLLYVTYTAEPRAALAGLEPTVQPADAAWERGIHLLGYRVQPLDEAHLAIDLYWEATAAPGEEFTVFTHVLRDGASIGGHDGPVAGGYYPTGRWRAGDVVVDRHVAELTAPYMAGECTLEVGLYRPGTIERLRRLGADGRPGEETAAILP
jgi:hypothetical protein